jgi:hypothetical protein
MYLILKDLIAVLGQIIIKLQMDQAKSLHEAYLGPSPVLSLDVIWTHGVPWGETLGESC